MSTVETAVDSRIVAVYPDHASAEQAVRRLIKEGFDMKDVSIIGRDFQVEEEPIGFLSARDFIGAGAGTGAWVGGLFGLLVGAAFLVLPGVGPVVIAGPLTASLLGGLEGAVAGAAIGALSGALIGLGIPRNQALKYEAQVKAGKFLVVVHGTQEKVERAREVLSSGANEGVEVFHSEAA